MNPFSLENNTDYKVWRNNKLANYPFNTKSLWVEIEDPFNLSPSEHTQLKHNINHFNFSFYRIHSSFNNKKTIHQLGLQLGLKQLDNNICADHDKLTSIKVCTRTNQHNYIPYSSRQLSWHTDGYYNKDNQQIKGVLLHCVRPAKKGGVSYVMDQDIAYILLRDHNPDFIRALQHPKAFIIPDNILNGVVIRPAISAAVFSYDPDQSLHMRYSARQRNIIWRDDPTTLAAVDFLKKLWSEENPYIAHHTLQTGEGLLCNNSLHRRSNFEDWDDIERKRLLYRGRYFDRIQCL